MLDQGYMDFFPLESLQLSRTQVSTPLPGHSWRRASRPHLSALSFRGLLSSLGLSPQPLLGVLLRNWHLLSGLSVFSIFKPLKWPLSSCPWRTSLSTHGEVKVNLRESVFSFCPAAFRDQADAIRLSFKLLYSLSQPPPHIPLLMSPPELLESRPHLNSSSPLNHQSLSQSLRTKALPSWGMSGWRPRGVLPVIIGLVNKMKQKLEMDTEGNSKTILLAWERELVRQGRLGS